MQMKKAICEEMLKEMELEMNNNVTVLPNILVSKNINLTILLLLKN